MSKITATPEETSPCHYAVAIEVPPEVVDSTVAEVEKTFLNYASLPGFRPGKAPVNLLRRRFQKRIDSESRERLVREGLQDAIKNLDVTPITMPTFIDGKEGKLAAGQAFAFTVEFDVEPTFELPAYEGIEIERPVLAVDDEAVDSYLERMRQERATFQSVERATMEGDLVKVTYTSDLAAADDVPEEAERMVAAEESWLILDQPEMMPGTAAGLAGIEAEGETDLEITFPDSFHVEYLRNKTGKYHFKVLEIQGREAPALDDEFAKMMGAESLDDLRGQIREMMAAQYGQMQAQLVQGQATDKLIAQLDFPLPPRALDHEVESQMRRLMYQRYREQMERRRNGEEAPAEEEQSDEEREAAMRTQAQERAVGNLRLRYALDAIAKKHELTVDDGAVAAEVERFRNNLRLTDKQFARQYDVEMVTMGCRDDLLRQAALDYIVDKARITDVSPPAEEPAAGDDESASAAKAEE